RVGADSPRSRGGPHPRVGGGHHRRRGPCPRPGVHPPHPADAAVAAFVRREQHICCWRRAKLALLTDVWVVEERIRGRTPLGSYVFGLFEGPRRRVKSGCGTRAYGERFWGWYLSWSRGCASTRRRGRWSCRFVPRARPAGGAGAVGSGHRGMTGAGGGGCGGRWTRARSRCGWRLTLPG